MKNNKRNRIEAVVDHILEYYGGVVITVIVLVVTGTLLFGCLHFQAKKTQKLIHESLAELQELADEQEAHLQEAIDDGYTIYRDGELVTDRSSVNVKSNTYLVTIDDETKTIYLEKNNAGDNSNSSTSYAPFFFFW